MEKFKNMTPMKYLGASPAKAKVAQYMENPELYKGWYASTKVDGEYGRVIKDENGEVLIQGRGKSRITGEYVDKTAHLPHIVKEMEHFPNGTVLLGEFAFDIINTSSLEVATIFRCLAPKAIERQKDRKINFYVFDILAYKGAEVYNYPFIERMKLMNGIVENFNNLDSLLFEHIHFLKWIPAEEGIPLLDKVLLAGGEGIMIMNGTQPYMAGSRRGTVGLKIKKEMGEMTLKVVDLVAPKKEYEGKNPDTWPYRDSEGNPVTEYYYRGWVQGVVVDYKGRHVKITSGISDFDAMWLPGPEGYESLENGTLYAEVIAMEEVQGTNQELPSLRHPVVLRIRTDYSE